MITIRNISTRFLPIAFLLTLFAVTGVSAQQNSEAARSSDKESSTAANVPAKKAEAAPSVEDRLRALEQIIERQQREIETLRGLIEKRNDTTVAERRVENSKAETASLQPAPDSSPDLQTNPPQRRSDERGLTLAGIKVSGDLRFRVETFSNQGFDSPVEGPFRPRLRVRARVGFDGKINNNFTWGIRLASGAFTDPISTNQTLSDFFERKPFGIERAFVKYDSLTDRVGVELVAGKFEPTFRRTQLVWDDDVNVEGISEAIYFKTDSRLKQIKFVAFQLPFDEVSGGSDGELYGGQLQTDWNLSSKVSARVDAAYYDWVRADDVLRALGASTTVVNGGINNGAAIAGGQNGALGTTNRVITDSEGRAIGLLANFHLLDILTSITWKRGERYPLTFGFDFVRNLTHRIDDEKNGYLASVQMGRYQKQGDWLLNYTYARIEQDAVLVPFNFSDILATNSRAHIPTVGYRLADKVAFQWTGLFSKRAHRLPNNSPFNRWLDRLQFDITYQF